jgi:quinol monooxygenase YgiN
MIVIAGTVRLHPEHRAEAIERALRMAAASEAEPGCRTYRFFADLRDPDTFFIFEEWEDETALAAHFQTAHMAEFREHLPKLVAGEMRIQRYAVSAISAA